MLDSVQQSRFGCRFAFKHFNFQIETQIKAPIRRTYLKPILNTSKLKIEVLIVMKWNIFLSVPTVASKYNTEMYYVETRKGLLNSSQGAMQAPREEEESEDEERLEEELNEAEVDAAHEEVPDALGGLGPLVQLIDDGGVDRVDEALARV